MKKKESILVLALSLTRYPILPPEFRFRRLFYLPLFCYNRSMIISYFGKQFFKVQYGDTVLAFNPISKDSKTGKPSRFGADIVISSTNHPDYNGLEMVSHGDTIPFAVKGPGDYEIKGIFIKGILNEGMMDGKKFINTIYTLTVDNISLCFLGAVTTAKLSSEIRGQIDDVDVVFVPIGANDTVLWLSSRWSVNRLFGALHVQFLELMPALCS